MKQFAITSILFLSFSICHAQRLFDIPPSNNRVHKGFFLSMSGGANYSAIDADVKGQYGQSYTGIGPIMDLKIGGAIQENLILHATLITNFVSGPEITTNGQSQNTSDNWLIGEDFLGGGITYYTASNLFFSGSLGIGNYRIMDTTEETSVSSDGGLGVQLKAGKEWWVSRRWGLGFAFSYGRLKLTNTPGGGLEELMNSDNFGIHFNATLN
ncbi:MAG: hypothetical protein JNK09_21390 [Prolixibacteraceae bacterium]|nr:hypothetical protein [Prolixibacteraceae bacterium]